MPKRHLRVLLFVLTLAANVKMGAAAAPDWLLALRRVTLPEYPPETDAIVLLDEVRTVVDDRGEIKNFYRIAYKILSPRGENLARVRLSYGGETEVSGLQAWNLKAGGTVHEVTNKEAVVSQLADYALFQDTKTMLLVIPQVEVGSVIGYEYQQRHRRYILQDFWYFEQRYPLSEIAVCAGAPCGLGISVPDHEPCRHPAARGGKKPLDLGT